MFAEFLKSMQWFIRFQTQYVRMSFVWREKLRSCSKFYSPNYCRRVGCRKEANSVRQSHRRPFSLSWPVSAKIGHLHMVLPCFCSFQPNQFHVSPAIFIFEWKSRDAYFGGKLSRKPAQGQHLWTWYQRIRKRPSEKPHHSKTHKYLAPDLHLIEDRYGFQNWLVCSDLGFQGWLWFGLSREIFKGNFEESLERLLEHRQLWFNLLPNLVSRLALMRF